MMRLTYTLFLAKSSFQCPVPAAGVVALRVGDGAPRGRLTFATKFLNRVATMAWDPSRRALLVGGNAGPLPKGWS